MSLRQEILKELKKMLIEDEAKPAQSEEKPNEDEASKESADAAPELANMAQQTFSGNLSKCSRGYTGAFWKVTCAKVGLQLAQMIENSMAKNVLKIKPRKISRISDIQGYVDSMRNSNLKDVPTKQKYPNLYARLKAISDFVAKQENSTAIVAVLQGKSVKGPEAQPGVSQEITNAPIGAVENKIMDVFLAMKKAGLAGQGTKLDDPQIKQMATNVMKYIPPGKTGPDAYDMAIENYKKAFNLEESKNWLDRTREATASNLFERLVRDTAKK